jgi:rhodanese-related sulfurtransferase
MKPCLILLSLLASFLLAGAAEVANIAPAEAARLVAGGQAVLVDIREPSEWTETGVAAPAVLLAKSAFDAEQAGGWKPFLAKSREKEIILYCRSGRRAGTVAEALAALGYKVANGGGFRDWRDAGLPVRAVPPPKP